MEDFKAIPGKGVQASIDGERYYIGKTDMFESVPEDVLDSMQKEGLTTMVVGNGTGILGIIGLADAVREHASVTVANLQKSGKKVLMLTGDNSATATAIAGQLGITEFYADLLPDQKVEQIRRLQSKHGKVAMVGDGINDAPALAAADVGIAMGVAGTDTALETADIALMTDDLSRVPEVISLSRKARHVIRQNVWAAILIKFCLAIGVFPGLVTLVTAVLVGDMGATFAVTANAMRLANLNKTNKTTTHSK